MPSIQTCATKTRPRSFDAREICRLAADCYERGEALPATLTAQERSLAATFVNALVTTATENWWCDDPLPRPEPAAEVASEIGNIADLRAVAAPAERPFLTPTYAPESPENGRC